MLKKSIQKNENIIISKSDLCEIFLSGCKDCSQKNIGLEYEKLGIKKTNFEAASYFDISSFLLNFQKKTKENWLNIKDNDALVGLVSKNGTITLEPGAQTELSLKPMQNIFDIETYLKTYNIETAKIADKQGVIWLGYGIQPISTYRNINIIPKKRYECMTRYLPNVAPKPFIMMRETAGIQVSVDYKSEEDAMKKFALSLKLSPIVSAMFANSPIRNGRLTKYKSNRALSWLEMDSTRCGLVSAKALRKGDFTFQDYVEILLDVPMIFIERENSLGYKNTINLSGLTFREFLKNGHEGYFATKEDWLLHLSLYFPDVRFKNYIEIRNHDNQRQELICSIPAFWKGLLYNDDAISAVEELLKDFSYFDFEYLRRMTPKNGLDVKIKHHNLKDYAQELVKISSQSLKLYGLGEEVFLIPIEELLKKNLTPADIIIQNWESIWAHKIEKFIEYSKLS